MKSRARTNGRALRRRWLLTATYLAYVYVATYFLIMEPCVPAFDMEAKEWTYHSSCRLGPGDIYLPPGGFTMAVPTLGWAQRVFEPIEWPRHQLWPSADPEVLFHQPTAHVIVHVTFFVFLFIPVWIPMLVFREAGLRNKCRPFWGLLPAAWYTILFLPNFEPHWALVAVGMMLAYVALALSARGWRQLVNAPLWLALAAATARIASVMWERL